MKRKRGSLHSDIRDEEAAHVAAEAEAQANPLHCRICEVMCNSEAEMESHVKGKKHNKKQFTEADIRGRGGEPKPELWCAVCKVGCNSDAMMKAHLDGKRHAAKESMKRRRAYAKHARVEGEDEQEEITAKEAKCNEREEEMKEEGIVEVITVDGEEAKEKEEEEIKGQGCDQSNREEDGLWCEVCEVKCNSKRMMVDHRKGRKHRAKEARIGPKQNEGDGDQDKEVRDIKEEENKEFWCLICRVKYDSQATVAKHLKGAEHNARLSQRWGRLSTWTQELKEEAPAAEREE